MFSMLKKIRELETGDEASHGSVRGLILEKLSGISLYTSYLISSYLYLASMLH